MNSCSSCSVSALLWTTQDYLNHLQCHNPYDRFKCSLSSINSMIHTNFKTKGRPKCNIFQIWCLMFISRVPVTLGLFSFILHIIYLCTATLHLWVYLASMYVCLLPKLILVVYIQYIFIINKAENENIVWFVYKCINWFV